MKVAKAFRLSLKIEKVNVDKISDFSFFILGNEGN